MVGLTHEIDATAAKILPVDGCMGNRPWWYGAHSINWLCGQPWPKSHKFPRGWGGCRLGWGAAEPQRCNAHGNGGVRVLRYHHVFYLLFRQKKLKFSPMLFSEQVVIPAEAGIHASDWRWIPAFAGMTTRLPQRFACPHH